MDHLCYVEFDQRPEKFETANPVLSLHNLIGEAYIMRVLQDSAQGALPSSEHFEVGGSTWSVVLEDAQGSGENLMMSGRIKVGKKGR